MPNPLTASYLNVGLPEPHVCVVIDSPLTGASPFTGPLPADGQFIHDLRPKSQMTLAIP